MFLFQKGYHTGGIFLVEIGVENLVRGLVEPEEHEQKNNNHADAQAEDKDPLGHGTCGPEGSDF
jgi:hypothetical protein